MHDPLRVIVEEPAGEPRLKLVGVIDENQELGQKRMALPPGRAVIDLGGLERINSMGVRWWLHWVADLEKRGVHLVFVRCPRPIVNQVNLVNNFLGERAWVESFYLPYYCPRCDVEQELLALTEDFAQPPHRAPSCWCDKCDGAMEFDDIEEAYLSFLERLRTRTPPKRARVEDVNTPTVAMEVAAARRARRNEDDAPTIARDEPGTAVEGPEASPPTRPQARTPPPQQPQQPQAQPQPRPRVETRPPPATPAPTTGAGGPVPVPLPMMSLPGDRPRTRPPTIAPPPPAPAPPRDTDALVITIAALVTLVIGLFAAWAGNLIP